MGIYEPDSMHDVPQNIKWVKADGCIIWDEYGDKYLDFSSGIFVANVGHNNKYVKRYIKRAIKSGVFHSFAWRNEWREKFLGLFHEIFPYKHYKTALFSDGSMAVDTALRLAKEFTGRKKIVAFKDSYHGNTHECRRILSEDADYLLPYPKSPDADFYEDVSIVKRPEEVAAIIFEPYQGWSVYTIPDDYEESMESWANENGVVLIADEIQAGFWRTGKLFCHQHHHLGGDAHIQPDMVIWGKGVSSSLPLSGVTGRERIMSCLDGKTYISNTHSGNPIACAAAYGALKFMLEKKIWENVKRNEEVMRQEMCSIMQKFPNLIEDIRCIGMVGAFHLPRKEDSEELSWKVLKNGLMPIFTHKKTFKIGPPLIMSQSMLRQGFEIIRTSLEEMI